MNKNREPLFHPCGGPFDKLRGSGFYRTKLCLTFILFLVASNCFCSIPETSLPISLNAHKPIINNIISAHPELVEGRPVGVEERNLKTPSTEQTLSSEAKKELADMIASGNFKQLIDFSHPRKEQAFYKQYLSPYYPRACVIGGFHFSTLPLEQVDQAIADVVKMFKDEPWFYFVDKPEQFQSTRYWEYIVDQLAIMHEFLVRLKVDPVTKKVFNPAQGTPATAKKKADYLLDYLLNKYSPAVAESIAISYDYVNKLFIDAIKREDIQDAIKYLTELEYLEENLRNTRFERDYHEHMTTVVRSLFELLKKRNNISDEEVDALRNNRNPGSFNQGSH